MRNEKLNKSLRGLCIHGHFAFTLAEVLITLLIIGVVAAMTIPTVVTHTALGKYRVQFKKAVATLSEGAMRGQGDFELNYESAVNPCETDNEINEGPTTHLTFCALFNGELKGRFIGNLGDIEGYSINIPATEAETPEDAILFDNDTSNYIAYELTEGIVIAFHKDAAACTLYNNSNHITDEWLANNTKCIGFVDLNGIISPNTVVSCPEINPAVLNSDETCVVPTNVTNLTDIYPILYHDSTVNAMTPAARNVLTTAKKEKPLS